MALSSEHTISPVVLAMCDALVMKALEKVGMYQLKADRSRFREAAGHSLASVHTLYPATDETVTKVLRGAWDVLPHLLEAHASPTFATSSENVAKVLEEYVQDLAITGEAPNVTELAYRLGKITVSLEEVS